MRVLLAGGGTAGHTSPLLATADALRRLAPRHRDHLPGHAAGARGADRPRARATRWSSIPTGAAAPPARRRPAAACPGRLRGRRAGAALEVVDRRPARRRRRLRRLRLGAGLPRRPHAASCPLVVHEGTPLPGLANKLGARFTAARRHQLPRHRAAARDVRRAADPPHDRDPRPGRAARRGAARPSASTRTARRCWSPAARRARPRLNDAVAGRGAGPRRGRRPGAARRRARSTRLDAGPTPASPYVVVALRRPDGPRLRRRRPVLCRAGANTVTEVAAVGLPAVFVPLPIGNGEQRAQRPRRWSRPAAALMVDDAGADRRTGSPRTSSALLTDRERLAAMGAAAARPDPARRRREAGPDVLRRRRGRPGEDPGPRRASRPPPTLGRVHFVGIGGAGLSGIARIMARPAACRVTGSDDHDSPFLPSLRELGVPVHVGHDAGHVGDADTVVVIHRRPRRQPRGARGAARAGCGCCPGRPALESVMAGRPGGRGGRHPRQDHDHLAAHDGAARCGADPTYAIGGELGRDRPQRRRGHRRAVRGRGRRERRRVPASTGPYAALVTNVDADHLDVWGTEEAYRAAFDGLRRHDRPRRLPGAVRRRPGRRRAGRRRARPRAATS